MKRLLLLTVFVYLFFDANASPATKVHLGDQSKSKSDLYAALRGLLTELRSTDNNTSNGNEPTDNIPPKVVDTWPQGKRGNADPAKRILADNNSNGSPNKHREVQDNVPTKVVDNWPEGLIGNVSSEKRILELVKLAEENLERRQSSCYQRGVIDIAFYYDDAFAGRFGNAAEEKITTVVGHMQTYLDLSSLSFSAGGQTLDSFRLNVVGKIRLSGVTITAEGSGLDTFSGMISSDSSKPTAHHYMLLSYQNNESGVAVISGRTHRPYLGD